MQVFDELHLYSHPPPSTSQVQGAGLQLLEAHTYFESGYLAPTFVVSAIVPGGNALESFTSKPI